MKKNIAQLSIDFWLLMPKLSDAMAYLKPLDRKTFLQLFDPNFLVQVLDMKTLIQDLINLRDMDNQKWEVLHRGILYEINNQIRTDKTKK